MSFTSRTIVHTFSQADGTTASGEVSFNLPLPMTNDGTTIIPSKVAASLNGSGAISVLLAANDDPDTLPTGVQWQVTLRIAGADPLEYSITVPSAGSGNVDLGSLLPSAAEVS